MSMTFSDVEQKQIDNMLKLKSFMFGVKLKRANLYLLDIAFQTSASDQINLRKYLQWVGALISIFVLHGDELKSLQYVE